MAKLPSRRLFLKGSAATLAGLTTQINAAPAVHTKATDAFDYIVIGAGSSGCVIANRLSEDKDVRVLLLEAGEPDNNDPKIASFTRYHELQGTRLDWQYQTEPEPHLNKREIAWPRGKVLGGSSSINAMIYIRGHRLDFDHWNYLGNEGWSYEDVLPYFKRSEANATIKDEFHGRNGLLSVAPTPRPNAYGDEFFAAAGATGFGGDPKWDFNGKQQENVAGYYQHTIKDGRRHSAATAFLTPFRDRRANLHARTGAFVTRVLLDGNRATGVEYVTNEEKRRAVATRETIICAGAVDSPQLLMLSGIGPSDHLRTHGIDVKVESPGVGQNLQDHLSIWPSYSAQPAKGQLIPCGGLFVRTQPGMTASSPDIQFHIYWHDINNTPKLGFGVTLVRPHSIGSISLASNDPLAAPKIRANYLDSKRDMHTLERGLELARDLAAAKAFKLLGEELPPFKGQKTPKQIHDVIRETATTLYHPVGTCKMGHDEMAVVDPTLRVHGIDGLRVADASIMPTVVNGNTNAPCIMIGEKGADMIKHG